MKKVVVSAPGKLHLSGEHAVVYGEPAVLASISKRLYVTLEGVNSQDTAETSWDKIKNDSEYAAKIVRLFKKSHPIDLSRVKCKIASDIPAGAGLGSSAALAVALIAALSQWIGLPWDVARINELAYKAEQFQHGNPSGGDNTVVTYGGILWYRKELDFLKTFWLLSIKIPRSFPVFLLVNTGRAETTKELVEYVAKLQKKNRPVFALLLAEMENITRTMVRAIHDENEAALLSAIQKNQQLLERMGVVSVATKELLNKIESLGGAAKISGAGGRKVGSGVIWIASRHKQTITDLLKNYQFLPFEVQLGGEGVRREQIVL